MKRIMYSLLFCIVINSFSAVQTQLKPEEIDRRAVEKDFLDAAETVALDITKVQKLLSKEKFDEVTISKSILDLHMHLGYFLSRIQSEMTQPGSPFSQAMFIQMDHQQQMNTLTIMSQVKSILPIDAKDVQSLSGIRAVLDRKISAINNIRQQLVHPTQRYYKSILGLYTLTLDSYNKTIIIPNIKKDNGLLSRLFEAVFGSKLQANDDLSIPYQAEIEKMIVKTFLICVATIGVYTIISEAGEWIKDKMDRVVNKFIKPTALVLGSVIAIGMYLKHSELL